VTSENVGRVATERRSGSGPRIALTTYSVKPRGGVVHTLELAEALADLGADVTVIAMGDPDVGFFREVGVPTHIVQAPAGGRTLDERVPLWIAAMAEGLESMRGDFDIVHSQDCISARAAARVRDGQIRRGETAFELIRTVHHVDDFTTQSLMDCQKRAILEPDRVLVVSQIWRRLLQADYGVDAEVVANGVRADRFARPISAERRAELRSRVGATDRFLFLTIGGIEPRKGSTFLVDALGRHNAAGHDAVLAVIGGHSFQDYRPYRESVFDSLATHGVRLDEDLYLLGTVDDDELPDWFQAADAFVFPSLKEGWGLVVLEAMGAGLPVLTSDIEVFHEFLEHGVSALMTAVGDAASIADGMALLQNDRDLVRRLASNGVLVATQYSWEASARQHLEMYQAGVRAV
jgi:glycosyltransferase-like protein